MIVSNRDLLFPASVVGSLPRPFFVRDLIAGTPPDRAGTTHMDSAVRYVAAMQEAAGLDVITDGEWRRKSYIGVMAELAAGFELSTNPLDGRPWTVVVEPLRPRNPGFVAREVEFLRSVTNRRIKVALPAPALLGERLWNPERSRRAYPTREAFVRDCIPILRAELRLLGESGADIVQIDDPHLCLFVDENVRAQHTDPEAAADFAVETVNSLVADIEGVQTAVHLCRRAGARARGENHYHGGYDRIIDQINRLKVDHLTLEFSDPGSGDVSVLARIREDFEIGLGCVGTEPGRLDSVPTIVSRVEEALRYVAPERVTLNPDCGFAPGSAAVVSLDEVYQKLKNESVAARILRERHSG